jgi:UDP-3-O-[3-hydroxymyristoyl] glucosamine N-acyltransferase
VRMRLGDLAEKLGLPLHGDAATVITGVAGIREAGVGDLTFLGSPKYEAYLSTTVASAIIMPEIRSGCRAAILLSPDPRLAFLTALQLFEGERPSIAPGVHATAVLGKDVSLGAGVAIGPNVVLGDSVELGARSVVMAGAFLGDRVRIGADALIYPNVVIREDSVLGSRVILHAGVVIGSDGFGFARDGDTIRKIPQIGNVEIGDDVEIGANTTIDRATTGTTRIDRGTKIDNLVMIAHNVHVGANSFLCAQVGVSGSAVIGRNVTLAGQSGVIGHIEIGDGVQVGAQGGVTKSIPAATSVSGYPALPHQQARKIYAAMRFLPGLMRTIRDLSRKIEELEARFEQGGKPK